MNRLFLYTTIALLTAATASTGLAKDKKKDKDKDTIKDKDRPIYAERGHHYFVGGDGQRHWIDGAPEARGSGGYYRGSGNSDEYDRRSSGYDRGYEGDNRGSYQSNRGSNYGRGQTRTIYVIENRRPVERVVYVDSDSRYYRWVDGRRIYVTGRHYNSYPSRDYYPDGRPRLNITIPF